MSGVEPNKPASFYAKLFDITERRVQQLAKEGVIPKAARGQYPMLGTIKGYVNYLQERALGSDLGASPSDLQSERVRLTKANADKVELEVSILDGTLIPAETVENVQGNMVSAFRAKMLSLPTKTAGKVQNTTDLAEIEEALRLEVHEALTELSDYDPEQYGIQTIQKDSKPSSAAAESDG